MSLYVNGDSWSFALKEKGPKYPHLWPNIVSKKLNKPCFNDSIGCGSNSRIVDCLRNQIILGLKPDLIIIALTAHHRWHIPAENFGAWSIGPHVARNDRTGESNDHIRDVMNRYSYNELDSVYRYYRDIWTMDLLCKQLNCPYIFVQVWDEELEKLGLLSSSENIYNYVSQKCPKKTFHFQEYIRAFEKFKELSKNWPYTETALSKLLDIGVDYDETGHPNDQGHYKMADKILEILEERYYNA
jgi:hypothetical protein